MSTANPEPTDVGPSAGGDLRASDADRNQVIDLLTTAYAEGRLTTEEHGERIDQAASARTFDDLVPLTRDLVPIGVALPSTTTPERPFSGTAPVGGKSPALTLVGILGGGSRTGHWRVPREITTYCLMGGVELDFSQAEFEADTVTITAYNCMGGLEIKVPAGVEVRDESVGIMGGTEIKHTVAGNGPRILLKGVSLMGGMEVTGPAKQIEREQRRARRRLGRG